MYLKYSSFKSIALLLVLCFTVSLVLPAFNPKQEAEACLSEWWEAITQSAAGSGLYKIIEEALKKKAAHKSGVDASKSHGLNDHLIIIVTGAKRYKCGACGATDSSRANLETSAHRLMYTCEDNDDTAGCDNDVYQCHSDKEKHKQIKHCTPCFVDYRVCVGGHDDCDNDDES